MIEYLLYAGKKSSNSLPDEDVKHVCVVHETATKGRR